MVSAESKYGQKTESLRKTVCRLLLMAELSSCGEAGMGWAARKGQGGSWPPKLGPQNCRAREGRVCTREKAEPFTFSKLFTLKETQAREKGRRPGETSLRNVSLAGHRVLPLAPPPSVPESQAREQSHHHVPRWEAVSQAFNREVGKRHDRARARGPEKWHPPSSPQASLAPDRKVLLASYPGGAHRRLCAWVLAPTGLPIRE